LLGSGYLEFVNTGRILEWKKVETYNVWGYRRGRSGEQWGHNSPFEMTY
jgi:hypothetical protein